MTARNWLVFAGMMGVLFVMIVMYGMVYDPTKPASRPPLAGAEGDTLRVSATALAGAFVKDRKRADRTFKNRLCVVTGHIVGFDVNWLGEPVVQLEGDRNNKIAVSLIFQKAEQGVVDLLEKGETLTALGICVGLEPRYGIRFKQCMVVSRAETKGQWDMKTQ
jgi:hypothetical protein